MSWLRPYQPPSSRELSGRSSGGTRSATSHLSQGSSRQTSLRTRSQGLGELFRTKGAVHQSLMQGWASSVGQGLQQGADFLPTRKQPTQWVAGCLVLRWSKQHTPVVLGGTKSLHPAHQHVLWQAGRPSSCPARSYELLSLPPPLRYTEV